MSEKNQIDRDSFLAVYVPMALAGATALAIAVELGVEQEADEKNTAEEKMAQFVSQKASNYRTELRNAALAAAKEAGLGEEETQALVDEYAAKLPKLKHRARAASNLVSFLDELLAKCDAPDEGEESTETPS